MQIRILPDTSLPAIIYSFSLPNLPQELQTPAAWECERQRVAAEDLELPHSVYAFDKATWMSSIVHELTFDMATMTISVLFVDSQLQQWPLRDASCVRTLKNMLLEVHDAAKEERDRKIAMSQPPTPTPSMTTFEVPSPKSGKHKKQRSLFHFVVSLVTPSTPSFPALPEPPRTPSLPLSDVATELLLNHAPLRLKARSVLVDAYRRHVACELRRRLPAAGYTAWVAQSMLRCTTDEMTRLVEYMGGVIPPPSSHRALGMSMTRRSATHLFYDEDDLPEELDGMSLADSVSTDTDGSSLHTPLSTPVGTEVRRHTSQQPSLSMNSDADRYHDLQQHALHLRQVLVHVEAMHNHEEFEARNLQAVLAIRARRRAWSNRALLGGATHSELGFAMPRTSSPLARCEPVTAGEYSTTWYGSLPRRTVQFDTTDLFPVDEVEEADALQFPGDCESAPAVAETPLVRPRIRVRTHSSHVLPPTFPSSPRGAPPKAPGKALDLQRLFVDEAPFGSGAGEFTLAMDAQDHSLLDDDDWLPSIGP
ncbi:unnamed protein product [Peniophora sp. CBMAI 1063]|nr:unnamed protein product [Peniophora sp. CBMAI 1063]